MSLSRRVAEWRFQGRRAIALEALASSAGGTLAVFGAAALLDRWASLPRPARLTAFAGWAAWLAWESARRLAGPWRALDDGAILAAGAREWPETRLTLASAWDLRDGPASPGTSEEMRAEHVARADRLAAGLPHSPLFRWRPSRRARRLAAAAAALLAANAALGDRASWARVLAPWSDASLESLVAVTPGDARPDWSAPAFVRAAPTDEGAAAGVRPASILLETRTAGGTWRALPWSNADAAAAEWRTAALSAPLDYRVRWRDRASRAYRLEPVAPPRWTRVEAVVREARGPRRFTLGEDAAIQARRGDWVEISGEPDAPLSEAGLRVSGRAASAMRRDGSSWKGGFLAQEDGALSFELVSRDGRRDPSPPSYPLTVAADAPPAAELLSPQVPIVASPQDSIVVTYAARDDGAITAAALMVALPGQAPRSVPLPVPAPRRPELLGDYEWSLAGLKAGTRAEFWIEAFDDASPRQRGVSEKGSLEIVDAEADHRAALVARDAADAAVERAAAEAEAARDAARAGDLAASARSTNELRPDWAAADAALRDWSRRAASDTRGDPGLAEEAARASEEFARAGSEALPAAEKSLAASDAEGAARSQAALAEQARGVQRALREGAKAQAVQDLARKLEEAGRSGQDMAAGAQELAARGAGGTVSAAELEKLESSLAEIDKALDELRRALKDIPELTPEQASGASRELPLDSARQAAGELRRALQSGDVAAAAKAARSLAEKLQRLARALDGAGRRAAESRGRRGGEAASRVKRAWQEAVEAQTRAAERARKVEDARLQSLLAAQRELLARTEADFDRAASSAAFSDSARLPLEDAARRLKGGDAAAAAQLMRSAAARLRSGGALDHASRLEALADRLQQGPPAPAADAAAARDAADAQGAALARARRLRQEVKDAAEGMGYLSGRIGRRVDAAVAEEDAGEGALRRSDSVEGLKRAEAALAILQEGGQDADSASSAAGGAASAMGGGSRGGQGASALSTRPAGRGAAGVRYERVRLPSADEYRPPRELREELQRSLTEPRPAAHDGAIKEYFKRLAR